MSTVIFFALLLIVGIVLWLFMQPAYYEVVRRRVIKVKPEAIYPLIVDLKHWPSWNPWLIHEPNTKLAFSRVTGAKESWYAWEGQQIGVGKITHQSLIENDVIEQSLELLKPIKLTSHVYWRFNSIGEYTEVTWGMRGKMPFLYRWLSKMMDGFVGKDYEIGLSRLAMQASDLSESYELEFVGEVDVEAQDYLASHFAGTLEDMQLAMPDVFRNVYQAVESHGMTVSGAPFTLYHQFNKKDKLVVCDIAVPVIEAKAVEGFISGSLLGQAYLRTTLKGDYEHLEKTWYSAFSHLRLHKYKLLMGKPMVERYMSDPKKSEGLGLVTYLDLPLK